MPSCAASQLCRRDARAGQVCRVFMAYLEGKMAKVGFIGLGVMGYPMAGYLQKAGHETTVYNRTTAKAEKWAAEYGGAMAASPQEAAEGCDFVMACVGNDDDLRSVTIADGGAFSGLKEGATFVDHTTASAKVAQELAAAAADKGCGFIDAPVSGGQAGAENGQLAIMCGGDAATFTKAEAVMDCYAKAIVHIGEVGAGQICKMVNQICIAGLVQGLAEGLEFANKAGLDGRKVVDAISGGAAGSWQMANRFEWVLDGAYENNQGFAVDWMRKDLGICFEHAEAIGADLPVAKIVDGFYGDVQKMDGGRWDTSSLVMRLNGKA